MPGRVSWSANGEQTWARLWECIDITLLFFTLKPSSLFVLLLHISCIIKVSWRGGGQSRHVSCCPCLLWGVSIYKMHAATASGLFWQRNMVCMSLWVSHRKDVNAKYGCFKRQEIRAARWRYCLQTEHLVLTWLYIKCWTHIFPSSLDQTSSIVNSWISLRSTCAA